MESPTRTFVTLGWTARTTPDAVTSKDVGQRRLGGVLRLSKEGVRRVQCSEAHGQQYLAAVRLRIGDLAQVQLVDSLVGVHQPGAHGTILTRHASHGGQERKRGCCRAESGRHAA